MSKTKTHYINKEEAVPISERQATIDTMQLESKIGTNSTNASRFFIFATVAIDAIGLGIVIPVLPEVIRRFVASEVSVSHIYGYFVAVYALMQFLTSPLLGRLSDRFGRRPILLISLFGAAIDYIFMAFAATLPLVFLGRVISGICGASFTVASAYMADISTDKTRAKNFGMIGAGFGLGFIIGPALGGVFGEMGYIYPFLCAAGFNFLNCVFGYFILPESLQKEQRRALQKTSLNPLRSLYKLAERQDIRKLVIAYGLLHLAGQTHPSIWTLYTEHRYGWSIAEVGISLTVVGVLNAISQGMLTGFFVKHFGEWRVLVFGIFGQAVSFIFFGLAYNTLMLYIVLIISALFWASQPALLSTISRDIPANQQGELQGSLMSLVSLATIINPLITTTLFALGTNKEFGIYLPGLAHFMASLFLFGAWFMLLAHLKRSKEKASLTNVL